MHSTAISRKSFIAGAAGLAAGCEQGAVFAAGELELDRVAVAVEFRRLQVGVIHLVDDVVGDGAAVHTLQQTLVGQIGDIASDGHGGNAQFLGQCGDTHRTAGTQPAQNQMLTL